MSNHEILQPVMFGTVKVPLPLSVGASGLGQVTCELIKRFDIRTLLFEVEGDGCLWVSITPSSESDAQVDAVDIVKVIYAAIEDHTEVSAHQS